MSLRSPRSRSRSSRSPSPFVCRLFGASCRSGLCQQVRDRQHCQWWAEMRGYAPRMCASARLASHLGLDMTCCIDTFTSYAWSKPTILRFMAEYTAAPTDLRRLFERGLLVMRELVRRSPLARECWRHGGWIPWRHYWCLVPEMWFFRFFQQVVSHFQYSEWRQGISVFLGELPCAQCSFFCQALQTCTRCTAVVCAWCVEANEANGDDGRLCASYSHSSLP